MCRFFVSGNCLARGDACLRREFSREAGDFACAF